MAKKNRAAILQALRKARASDLQEEMQKVLTLIEFVDQHFETYYQDVGHEGEDTNSDRSIAYLMERRQHLEQTSRDHSKQLKKYQTDFGNLMNQTKQTEASLLAIKGDLEYQTKFLETVILHRQHINNVGRLQRRKLRCSYSKKPLPNLDDELIVMKGKIANIIQKLEKTSAGLEKQLDNQRLALEDQTAPPPLADNSTEISNIKFIVSGAKANKLKQQEPILKALRQRAEVLDKNIRSVLDGNIDEELWETYLKALEAKQLAREKAKIAEEQREKQKTRDRINERRRAEKILHSHRDAPIILERLQKKHSSTQTRMKRLEVRKTDLISDLVLQYDENMTVERLNNIGSIKVTLKIRGKLISLFCNENKWSKQELIDTNSDLFPRLRNLKRQIDELESELHKEQREIQRARINIEKLKNAEALIKQALPIGERKEKRPKRVVTEWRHAEELARDFMVFLGFVDASLTGRGADSGVDVMSSKAIGQVKMHNKGVPRYDIQRLVGEASVLRKVPIFFALSYSKDAVSWSEEHGIPLFKFERSGAVAPMTRKAMQLESSAR